MPVSFTSQIYESRTSLILRLYVTSFIIAASGLRNGVHVARAPDFAGPAFVFRGRGLRPSFWPKLLGHLRSQVDV